MALRNLELHTRNDDDSFAYGSVTEWLGRWTLDQQVVGSNPGLSAVECNPGQVVNTHVPLSPSSIIWYQPMGGDALWLGS